jgi:hypothetical protein
VDLPPAWPLPVSPWRSPDAVLPALLRQTPERREWELGLLYQCQSLSITRPLAPEICWNNLWR